MSDGGDGPDLSIFDFGSGSDSDDVAAAPAAPAAKVPAKASSVGAADLKQLLKAHRQEEQRLRTEAKEKKFALPKADRIGREAYSLPDDVERMSAVVLGEARIKFNELASEAGVWEDVAEKSRSGLGFSGVMSLLPLLLLFVLAFSDGANSSAVASVLVGFCPVTVSDTWSNAACGVTAPPDDVRPYS